MESVENGHHPDVQAIKNIEEEAGQIIEDIVREMENDVNTIEHLREEFNAWVEEKQEDVNRLSSDLDQMAENHNNEVNKYEEYVTYTNNLINDYNILYSNVQMQIDSGNWPASDIQWLNNLERDIESWKETVTGQLHTINRLEREYNSFKQTKENTEQDIQNEFLETRAYVEEEIQSHDTFVTEQTERIEEIKEEAQRQVDEIANDINYYVEEENQRLDEIVNQMESEYGANYTQFANLGPLLESGEFNKLSSALFNLKAGGGSKTEEAYNIAVSMQMAQVGLSTTIAHLNSKNSLLQSIADELNRLSSGMEVDEREIASLKQELETYHHNSLQRIQELEEGIRQKTEAYEEDIENSFIEILELHRNIIHNQALIIAHILLLNEDIEEFLHSLNEDKTKLSEVYDQEPYSIIFEMFDSEPPLQDIGLSITPYHFQDIQKKESLEGERKRNFTRGWYQILRSRNVFAEEKLFLANIFENTLEEVEDFFYPLFVQALTSSRVLVEEVRFLGQEASPESAFTGYRLVLGAETFWLDEGGNLRPAPVKDPLFQHVFTVPWEQDTELGREIREAYKSFKEQFKGKLEILGEKEKRAVVTAEALLRLAYEIRGEAQEESRRFLSLAQSLVYLALNFSPAGDAIDLYECVTGYDIFGQKLTGGERLLSGLSLFIGSRRLWTSFKNKFHNIFDPSASKHLKNYTRGAKWHKDLDKLLDYARSAEDEKRLVELIRAAKSLPKGVRVKRVLPGRSDKVAIIGRGMEDVPKVEGNLLEATRHLEDSGVTVEKFLREDLHKATANRLATEHGANFHQIRFKGTKIYKENVKWAKKIRDENYLVLDFGARGARERSIFYDTELSIIFNETDRMKPWR